MIDNKTKKTDIEMAAWFKKCFSKKGKTKAGIARHVGVSKTAAGNWEKFGQVKRIHIPKIIEYCEEPLPERYTKPASLSGVICGSMDESTQEEALMFIKKGGDGDYYLDQDEWHEYRTKNSVKKAKHPETFTQKEHAFDSKIQAAIRLLSSPPKEMELFAQNMVNAINSAQSETNNDLSVYQWGLEKVLTAVLNKSATPKEILHYADILYKESIKEGFSDKSNVIEFNQFADKAILRIVA